MKQSEKVDRITLSTLKSERGWTDALVRKYLGEPDATAPNPRYRNAGSPMRLYDVDRVAKMERDPNFMDDYEKARERSARASKVAGRKRDELVSAIERVEIEIPVLPMDSLIQEAIDHYEGRNWGCVQDDAPKDFLERITVNFVRHGLINYDAFLSGLRKRIGRHQAYCILKRRVLEKTATLYPALAAECQRQIDGRRDDLH